jgi:hypothetical protein
MLKSGFTFVVNRSLNLVAIEKEGRQEGRKGSFVVVN